MKDGRCDACGMVGGPLLVIDARPPTAWRFGAKVKLCLNCLEALEVQAENLKIHEAGSPRPEGE